MIIGISGTFGSGKDLVSSYLETKGFLHCSTSDALRQITAEKGREVNRENLRLTANEIEHEEDGNLAKQCLKSRQGAENVVVSGLRRLLELNYLRSLPEKFLLIFIDAPIEIRYHRLIDRSREGEDKMTLEEFKKREELESSGQSSQRLDLCKKEADKVIINEGTIEELHNQIDQILTTIF